MSANLVANVTISGNLTCLSTHFAKTTNVTTGFAIGGPYINASYGARIAGGLSHTAVIMNNGSVRTFGDNSFGQLGLGDTANRQTPAQVSGVANARSVACGSGHTAVLLVDGTVRMFGRNDVGQLGLGDTTTRLTPVQITGLSVALAVSCGFFHTAVLLVDGTVRTFGSGGSGRLGLGDAISRQTPVTVLNITSASAVACGAYHTSVLLANGTVLSFGYNNTGQLGLGDVVSRLTPVQVFGISSSAVAVSGGKYHTAILLADGTLRTFGFNTAGQLGTNDTTSRQTPVQVTGITSASVLACGLYFTSVLLADGTVRTFGSNFYGQNGVNDTTNRSTPVQVFGISSSASALGCGGYHAAVLLTDGSLRTFGRNTNGQLGTGDTASRLTPVQVVGAGAVTALGKVAAGSQHTAVVLSDGTVRTFGYNNYGQLGINLFNGARNTPIQVFGISSSASAVACGNYHTAVLLADGTVRVFGDNTTGQLGVNDTASRQTPVQVFGISSSATAVACGYVHTAVLIADGTVRTFGRGVNGQLGVNISTGSRQTPVQVWGISSSATAVACGAYNTAVLLADGTVRAFGKGGALGINSGIQQNVPVQVWGISSSATAIACGYYHTAVLLADGTVRTFGLGSSGQLGVNDTTNRLTPVQVLNISTATAVACGYYHTAVLLADGTVRTFGRNNEAELGVNDGTGRSTPVQVWGISSSATAVAGGKYHTAVLLADGTVRTFGGGTQGQLGDNGGTQRNTPVQVLNITTAVTPAPTAFLTSAATSITLAATGGQIWTSSATGVARTTSVSVSGGEYYTAVVLKDGTMRTFGWNNYGQLGVDVTGGSRLTPVTVLNITSATAVAGAGYITTVLLADGTVRTFGRNDFGGLGVNDTTTRQTPVQVFGISSSATAVASGDFHTAVLLANGTVLTFGRNDSGQLGINDTTSRLTPVTVLNISTATAAACGTTHTAVLLADGNVRVFGKNNFGQLGVNDTTSRQTPVTVLNISTATAVACGGYHTSVLLANGTVRTFGYNNVGQLGVNDTTSRLTPVQVFGISSSATAVACGGFHATVLLADGTVRTFGNNALGQLGVNDTTSRLTPVQVWGISSSAVAVASGFNHTVVILTDGTVRSFGANSRGQLGLNDTTSRLTPVAVFGLLGGPYTPTYVTATGLALGLSAPTYQLDLSTDKARKLATTTWTTGSDRRIKSDIQSANLARCVDIVDSLDLKYFKWNIPGVQGPQDSRALGWIAQDVKEFFPNSVRLTQDYGFDDFHNLDSDQLIKTMYGALKKMCQDTYGQ